MRKSNFKILALTAALIMPLSSCKETIIYVTPEDTPNDDIKTPIELSVGGVDGAVESSSTRAVITDETTDKSFNPLPAGSYIYIWMKSDYNQLADPNDYKGDQTIKYSVTRGQAVATTDNKTNGVEFTDTRIRYWDDAHARCSNLSILAVACPDLTYLGGTGTQLNDSKNPFTTSNLKPWSTEDLSSKTEIEWNIPHYTLTNEQYFNATNIKNRDLCFSNNIANYTSASKTDRRLKFNTGTKKFDKGKLVFYHALSKITVNIKIGNGFTGNNDFKFTTSSNTNENVFLQHFNIWGKFNVASGEWTAVNNDHQVIRGMYNKTGNTPNKTNQEKPAYELEALVIPYLSTDTKATKGSYLNDDATTKAIVFSIDNNTFEISRATLLKALKDKDGNGVANSATEVPLEAGKNYIFTFTVNKTDIKLTATIAEWDDVEANTVEPKINVTAEVGTKGASSTALTAFDFYMKEDGTTGNYAKYGGTASGTADGTTAWTFTNPIYWPTHDTHYHMRGVAPTLISVSSDKIAVQNKTYDAAKSLMVGTPEIADANKQCGSTKHTQVDMRDHGICAREGNINLNFRYMMSQIEVRLSTTTGDDKVNLANAKVEVINGYTAANVDLHNRTIVDPSSVADFTLEHVSTEDVNYRHSEIVPQVLVNGTNNLRFKITIYKAGTTEIDDIYYADIKDINVKVGTADPTTITSWEAGKHYIYTLDLRKTEIKVSATITDWVTATGSTNVWF